MVPHHKIKLQPDDKQKELDGHNKDDRQNSRNGARSQPIEELSIHSQGDKTKSNKTSVFSKTSSVRRILVLEMKALTKQEELQARLEDLRSDAKEIEIPGLQVEMAGLQEEMARKTKIAEKEIQMAQASSSCGSSFRSISPVRTPDDNLTKVSGWMDKTKGAENVASSTNVPPGYQQTSVSAPVITVRSTHTGECSAQVRT